LVTSCPSTLPVVGCCTTSSMQVCTQTNATATTLEGVLLGTKQGCMAQGGTWSPTRSP
jgi:hypothetical protein